jgi:hypothetical protein
MEVQAPIGQLWNMPSKVPKNPILTDFGQLVEKAILKKFKNKEEFLTKTGFLRKTLHGIITGSTDTRLTTIHRLANLLDIPARDFFPKKG